MKGLAGVNDEAAFFGLAREITNVEVIARFTVIGEPVSKARARFTKAGRSYTPDSTRAAEERVAWSYRAAAPGVAATSDRAYGVVGLFFSATRQRRDVDNMVKLLLDGLNKIAWADDSQVVEISGRKELVADVEDARTEVVVYRLGSIPLRTSKCEHCGTPYPAYRSQKGRRFCSAACDQARRKIARTRCCPTCGEAFEGRAAQIYCSRKCSEDPRTVEEPCGGCGTPVKRPVSVSREAVPACSPECRRVYWTQHPAKCNKGICDGCGGPTSKKTYSRCRACFMSKASS